jgi:formylglycine-generating enzyme required for sulfatase activity
MPDLASQCVFFPESIFMLGARYDILSETVREFDRQRHLSLRNILDSTPPIWCHLGPYHIGRRMISNGEYIQFLDYTEQDGEHVERIYDSAAIWRYVWQTLNMRVERARVPFERAPGDIVEFDEDYTDAQGFVDAWLSSLRFEIQRVLLSAEPQASEGGGAPDDSSHFLMVKEHGRQTRKFAVPREETLKRVFALIKYLLRNALLMPGEDLYLVLTDKEQDLVRLYESPAQASDDLHQLIEELKKAYRRRIDKRYVMPFQHGTFPIEPVQFLTRLQAVLRRSKDIDTPLALREILFPRYWPSATGDTMKKDFLGQQVPWDEQPVFGITLYEALAYTAWLSKISGRRVEIPTEAQFERASSWPVEEIPRDGNDYVLDPVRKLAFPWQDHNPSKDFHSYFGREGAELNNFYYRNKREYSRLLEETVRLVDDKNKVYQLEGFGWHWTCDRYNDDERKYLRFEDHDYPRWTAVTCREKDRETEPLTVFDYQPNSNVARACFVLKGSPDIIGGPGLTTRRYSANPLRAYPNVGFRIVVPEEA